MWRLQASPRNFHRTLPVHIQERVCNRFLFYLLYSLWHGINDGITCSKYSDNRAQYKVQKTRSNRGRLGRVVGSLPSDFLGQFAFGMWYHICLENIGLCIFNWHTFVAVRLSSDLKFGAYIWLVIHYSLFMKCMRKFIILGNHWSSSVTND